MISEIIFAPVLSVDVQFRSKYTVFLAKKKKKIRMLIKIR